MDMYVPIACTLASATVNKDSALNTPLPPASERLPEVRVSTYTINGILAPENGTMKLTTSIHPNPKDTKDALLAADAIFAGLVEASLEVNKRDLILSRISAENGRLKDEQLRLLRERDELNKHVSILQNQLEDLQR